MTDLRTVLRDIADDAPGFEEIRHRLARPRRRHTPVLAAAGVIAVVVITAGTAWLTRAPAAAPGSPGPSVATPSNPSVAAPSNPWVAACFGAADLATDLRADVGMGQKVGAVNTAPRPEDYFDICGTHWQNGNWQTAAAVNPDGSAPPAPEDLQLVTCVLPDGTYGIFPGTDATCAALDLPLAIAPDPSLGVIESPAVPTS